MTIKKEKRNMQIFTYLIEAQLSQGYYQYTAVLQYFLNIEENSWVFIQFKFLNYKSQAFGDNLTLSPSSESNKKDRCQAQTEIHLTCAWHSPFLFGPNDGDRVRLSQTLGFYNLNI